MIRFIHKLTGTVMLVSPEREVEYLAAGHLPAETEKKPAGKKRPAAGK